MTAADGTRFVFGYASTGDYDGNFARLNTVVSSRGFAVIFEAGNGWGQGSYITKACVANLGVSVVTNYCPPSALATAAYAYDGPRLASATKPDGAVERFEYVDSGSESQIKFIRPGDTAPWLINTEGGGYGIINEEGVIVNVVHSQVFADGRSYSYSYSGPPSAGSIAGGSYTDNLGNTVSLPYGFPILPGSAPEDQQVCTHHPCGEQNPDDFVRIYQQTSGPIYITDELGRTTTFDYCDPAAQAGFPYYYTNRCSVVQLVSFTDPEGSKTELTYQGSNVTQVRRKAKPGSSLPDIVTSATYNCVNPRICAKPLTITDAAGATTTFTYKAETGEILTETKPADRNGIQAVTRNEYVQRYAWTSNGSGGYVRAPTPVWLLSSTKTCRTTATVNDACLGGATDEVVISYDYGPDSGPNLLLLRGKVVITGGVALRSCYTYDAMGNRISETPPMENLVAC